jgi:putative peptide zinc metalloprotease protein
MAAVTKTFSELWYRVADFTPSLSAHLQVRRHTYRNETWFIVGDPASSKFYRFNAAAYRFLGLLNGRTTIQDAWDVCNEQLGDDAPTQQDCIDLLGQLQMFGLLRGDLPVDAQRLRERIDQIKEQKWQERTGRYVFWTVPLLNPEPILAKYANVARAVFSGWGMFALLVLIFFAVISIIPHSEELSGSFNYIIAPDNLIWLSLSFIILKVIHEFSHGYSCKARGGRVTEMGIFFMIVLPIPYCDATSSWAFPNKWNRILVSSSGVMAELAVASVAAIIWSKTGPGALHTICYNVMIVASATTVLFNLNPLLRYDGYYILADLLEIPNLATRSQELVKWITRRYLFGLKGEPAPPVHDKREGTWMVAHAVCAFPYRLLVMFSIVMVVAQQYFLIGLLLATFGFAIWFFVPVFKGLSYVISDPGIQLVRIRAMAVTFGFIILVIVLIGVVPMPARVYAPGVVEPFEKLTFRAPVAGFLDVVAYRDGEYVDADELVIRLSNSVAEFNFERAAADVEFEQLRRDAAMVESWVELELAEALVKDKREQYELAYKTLQDLEIHAPFSGRLIAPDLHVRQGSWFKTGEPIAVLATLDDLVLRAYVHDADYAFAFKDLDNLPNAEAKIYGRPGVKAKLEINRIAQAGTRTLDHRAVGMSTEGGTVAVDPTDPDGRRTVSPQWQITCRFEDPESIIGTDGEQIESPILPGTRVRIRFDLPSQPLIVQWYRRVRQQFASRFNV